MNKTSKRLAELTKYVDRNQVGIEVAPYFNHALPKKEGYKTLVMDVFETETLREYARKDKSIPDDKISDIENVDIVGDASDIAALARPVIGADGIGFVVSSHNFEHLPNPIKFLKGCSEILVEGGIVSMAIPDYRACFDHYRMPTRLSDWLRAYYEDSDTVAPERIFDAEAVGADYHDGVSIRQSYNIDRVLPDKFVPWTDLKTSFSTYLQRLENAGPYADRHFSVLFGHSFELMLRDLVYLELLDFEILEVTETRGHEFFVHLRKTTNTPRDEADFYDKRARLLRQVHRGMGPLAYKTVRSRQIFRLGEISAKTLPQPKELAIMILGPSLVRRIRKKAQKRRASRK